MRLLLVEDDYLLGNGVVTGLRHENHVVDWVQDGQSAKLSMVATNYDVVILDLGIPKINGLDLLAWFRKSGSKTPVLILTARDTVQDRVSGLDSGADDYMVKPFDLDELCARLRVLARRNTGRPTPLLVYGDIQMDPAARRVIQKDKQVELSAKEFNLFNELVTHMGQVLTREQLEEKLYGWGQEIESNSVEVHIHHLRRKLGGDLIKTIRGVGYIIEQR
ncbi:MAG: response regulator [Ferrovum sp.]|nr:response regulator [Ferrovum sp.]